MLVTSNAGFFSRVTQYFYIKYSSVSGVDTDETETISVMEGDSVTLHSDVTEIKRDDQILRTFMLRNSDNRLAVIYNQVLSIYDSKDYNKIFRGKLQINEQTGSLTITNINKLHSGLYKLQVINGGVKYKSFNLAVYGLLTVPVISDSTQNLSESERSSKQNCSLVCSVLNVSDVSLSWYKGNSLLSSISVSDLSISLSLPLEIECLDDSYSCAVAYSFTNQTKRLNITDDCQTDSAQLPTLHKSTPRQRQSCSGNVFEGVSLHSWTGCWSKMDYFSICPTEEHISSPIPEPETSQLSSSRCMEVSSEPTTDGELEPAVT
ncbi:uncharacterized protein LOC127160520 [Labeo rohita]|uniref:uncharacterized protein LOC127160520 n=1 Tax=Labeo rohita TaxID=84645 RepID=UPI0021E27366|nr:uncharacterized protein LOC127160520 [Labeo rohita]